MAALRSELPKTEILAITVLSNLNDKESDEIYKRGDVIGAVEFLARKAAFAGLGGIVCAATEAAAVRKVISKEMTINSPAIRPAGAVVFSGDDQSPDRIMTPSRALKEDVDRVIIGRPILRDPNPYDAVMRAIEEIENALSRKE